MIESFDYHGADTISDALAAAERAGERALFLAGGTDVMVSVNSGRLNRDRMIIYIGNIEELKTIELAGDSLRIGSLVTAASALTDETIKQNAPALRMTAREFASPQVRNRATIGGNVATGSPSGDFICSLAALGAEAVLAGSGRRIQVEDISIGVKQTCLAPGEIIERFDIPVFGAGSGSSFVKVGKRKSMSLSIANAACRIVLEEDGETVRDIRLAVGTCAPTVVRLPELEAALTGRPVNEAGEYVGLAQKEISPRTSKRGTKWYRNEIVPVLVHRAIKTAAAIANGADADKGVVS